MTSIINNWYWGRGAAGPYTFITADIVSEKKYDYDRVTVFMLARDGKVIADDGNKVTFKKSDIHEDPVTGKPVGNIHSYTYRDGDEEYELSYNREKTILQSKFIDTVTGFKKLAAKLIGFDGSYLRLTGPVTVTHRVAGEVVESVTEPAIWEQMYPGNSSRGSRVTRNKPLTQESFTHHDYCTLDYQRYSGARLPCRWRDARLPVSGEARLLRHGSNT